MMNIFAMCTSSARRTFLRIHLVPSILVTAEKACRRYASILALFVVDFILAP